PAIQPAGDFVWAALNKRNRRRPSRMRPIIMGLSTLASGAATAALLMFFLARHDAGITDYTTAAPDRVTQLTGRSDRQNGIAKSNTVANKVGIPNARLARSGNDANSNGHASGSDRRAPMQPASLETPIRRPRF